MTRTGRWTAEEGADRAGARRRVDHHLGGGEPDGRRNGRNGYGAKAVLTGTEKLNLQIPRDRLATFDPQLIPNPPRRFPDFDDTVVSLYAPLAGTSIGNQTFHSVGLYLPHLGADQLNALGLRQRAP